MPSLPLMTGGTLRGGGAFSRLGAVEPIYSYDATTPAFLAWQKTVHDKGGVVTVMPAAPGSPPNTQTPPAARYPIPGGGWRYEIAPAPIVAQDTFQRYKNSVTIATGKGAAVAENVAKAIVEAPQNAASMLTGVPRWLIPALIIVGGGLLLTNFGKSFGGNLGGQFGTASRGVWQAAKKRFAKNPRGRRRRSSTRRHASAAGARAARRRRRSS